MIEKLKRDANLIAKALKSGQIGDVLNHVNGCTAVRSILDKNHPFCRGLDRPLSTLPRSQGADVVYDFITRFGAAALLGVENTYVTSQSLLEGYRKFEENDSAILPNHLPVDYLLEAWRRNELNVTSQSPLSTSLFAQYVGRLYEICDCEISSEERSAIAHQALGSISALDALYDFKQVFSLISTKLLCTTSCYSLGMEAAGKACLQSALKSLDAFFSLSGKDPEVDNLIAYNIENICFLGLNAELLRPYTTGIDYSRLVEFSQDILKRSVKVEWGQGDIRKISIRLCGLAPSLDADMTNSIASEFNNAAEWEVYLEVKSLLESYAGYSADIQSLLVPYGFTFGSVSAKDLNALARQIRYVEIDGTIQHPLKTLATGQGDCRAVACLTAVLAATNGLSASVVLYPGALLKDRNNHVFLEVYDKMSFVQPKGTFVDQPEGLNFLNENIYQKALIRYPLEWLSRASKEVILSDLTENFALLTNG